MAEIKRVPLQSTDIGSQSKKKNEKTEKVKQIAPSFRFVLNLTESNEEKCPEFNYAHLLKSAEKKRKKDKKKDENTITNGVNLFDDDDDERVLDVARYFESKYGNRKKRDDVDLGAGYDESDSFIDNTDAYDEIVPESITTAHGGFYVNSGPLEYKDSENAKSLQQNNVGHDNENGNEDEEETSEDDSEDEEQEESKSSKRSKRCISSSENDETEEIIHPPKTKPRIEDVECSVVD